MTNDFGLELIEDAGEVCGENQRCLTITNVKGVIMKKKHTTPFHDTPTRRPSPEEDGRNRARSPRKIQKETAISDGE